MKEIFSPHLLLAKRYWKGHVQPGDLAIDATCGNGNDTLFLSQLQLNVIGIDIQSKAIETTRELLGDFLDKVTLYQTSHAEIDTLPLPASPRLIVYNLGYLPKADKSVTTQMETTLISVKKSLTLLAPGGALSITCYPGHEEGQREETALLEWVQELPPPQWSVSHHRWPNRPRSPSLLWIIKI